MANRIPTLTESELYDLANITRQYARQIRDDVAQMKADEVKPDYKYAPTPPHLFEALTQAAEQREKLADKLDDLASAF